MTLLDATATVIDHCKSTGAETDRVLAAAVERLEKRLRLLQLRRAKTLRKNRHKAFWTAMALFDGGVCIKTKNECFDCSLCQFRFYFGEFLKSAIITGHGRIKTLICPGCHKLLIGIPPPDEIESTKL